MCQSFRATGIKNTGSLVLLLGVLVLQAWDEVQIPTIPSGLKAHGCSGTRAFVTGVQMLAPPFGRCINLENILNVLNLSFFSWKMG